MIDVSSQDFKGPTPTSNWLIPNSILTGAYPADAEEHVARLTALLDAGIDTIVNLVNESYFLIPYEEDIKRLYEQKYPLKTSSITIIHFPIADGDIADDSAVAKLVDDLIQKVQAGHKIFIHCFGGRGRTYTIATILLGKLKKLNAEEALQQANLAFSARENARGRKVPETPSQYAQIQRMLES